MTYQIEQKNAQALLDYLQKRPYNEVFQLIPLLMKESPTNPHGLRVVSSEEVQTEDDGPEKTEAEEC